MRLILLLFLAIPLGLSSQPMAKLVLDINSGAASSRTSASGVAFQEKLFFPATTASSGTELWVSDGTAEGTLLFAEIVSGTGSSNPEDLIVVGDQLYFTAETAATGRELYRTDGTATGTVLVADIISGSASGIPDEETSREFGSWNGILFFTGQDVENNVELWRSEGTSGTTSKIREIAPTDAFGNGSSFPGFLTDGGDVLYFTADNDRDGRELWKTGGTSATTSMVADLNGGFSSSPYGLIMRNGTLYFAASNGFSTDDLYSTDGTPSGTQLVIDLPGRGLNVSTNTSTPKIRLLGDNLIFAAEAGTGPDLWISDGTAAGTRVLLDTDEVGFGAYTPQQFTLAGDLLFYKDEVPGTGIELWRTDGTTAGTFLVKDLDDGFFDSFSLPSFLHGHEGLLYFGADGDVEDGFGSTGTELYLSDGNTEGTGLVTDINPGSSDADPNNFVSVGEQLFFFADNGDNGQELYVLTPAAPAFELVSLTIMNPSCAGGNDGSIRVIVSGGTPPYFGGNNTSGDTTFAGLEAGNFMPNLSDASGNTFVTGQISLVDPDRLFASPFVSGQNSIEGGTIAITPIGGTRPYTFAWADTNLTTNIREDLDFGDYTVTITDANSCEFTATYTVDDLTSTPLLAAGSFRLYPTLANEQLTIEMAAAHSISTVSCIDLNGRVLATAAGGDLARLSLNNDFLPKTNGTYIISIVTTTGERGLGRIVVAR